VDFRGLGERAEKVRTVSSRIEWVERFRTSSKTRQRHELSGFIGEATYELPADESDGSTLGLLQWMLAGELIHVGKHTAWGNGCYAVGIGASAGALGVE
jgi:CRISPR-associated endoribonuclease Cas6